MRLLRWLFPTGGTGRVDPSRLSGVRPSSLCRYGSLLDVDSRTSSCSARPSLGVKIGRTSRSSASARRATLSPGVGDGQRARRRTPVEMSAGRGHAPSSTLRHHAQRHRLAIRSGVRGRSGSCAFSRTATSRLVDICSARHIGISIAGSPPLRKHHGGVSSLRPSRPSRYDRVERGRDVTRNVIGGWPGPGQHQRGALLRSRKPVLTLNVNSPNVGAGHDAPRSRALEVRLRYGRDRARGQRSFGPRTRIPRKAVTRIPRAYPTRPLSPPARSPGNHATVALRSTIRPLRARRRIARAGSKCRCGWGSRRAPRRPAV